MHPLQHRANLSLFRHLKACKFRSQTLVMSLFGILGQTLASSHCVHAYSGTLPMVLKSPGRGTWEDPSHCNRLLPESAGWRQTVFSFVVGHIMTTEQLMLLTYILRSVVFFPSA